jgi:hypothetical protein
MKLLLASETSDRSLLLCYSDRLMHLPFAAEAEMDLVDALRLAGARGGGW